MVLRDKAIIKAKCHKEKKTKKKERTLVVEGETEKETREGELWKMWKRTKGCIGWRRKKKKKNNE